MKHALGASGIFFPFWSVMVLHHCITFVYSINVVIHKAVDLIVVVAVLHNPCCGAL